MIQNSLIIREGIPLVAESFGQCHSINTKSSMFSGFLEAFYRFSEEVSESFIESINFKDAQIIIQSSSYNLLFILVTNKEDNKKILYKKLKKIIELFYNQFDSSLIDKASNMSIFNPFRKKLLEEGIVEEACGLDRCDLCPILMEEETVKIVTGKLKNIIKKKLD